MTGLHFWENRLKQPTKEFFEHLKRSVALAGKVSEGERLLKMTDESALSQGIKANARLFHRYNLVTVASGKKDFATAKAEAE